MALLTERAGWGRSQLRWAAVVAVWLGIWAHESRATTPEYQVKAAYLFQFARYVDWPPEAFATPTAPLVIGVVGVDPFGGVLDDLIEDEEAHGRPLVVRRHRRADEMEDCHILYIGRLGRAEREAVLARVRDRSVLTVSDTDGFTREGGMIGLVTDGGRVRMQINWGAAKRANLTLSSRLLRSGEIVSAGGMRR